jgi:hypothetical protein
MNLPDIFTNRQIRAAVIFAGILALLNLIINVLVLGGDAFVQRLNSNMVSPLSILTAAMAVLLWRQMGTGTQNRLQWGSLLIGWLLWAVAELLWAAYSYLGQNPYPSWADLFFVIGYIPISFGFLSRIRTLPKNRKRKISELLITWGIPLILLLAIVYFVLPPIIQDFDLQRLLESILNLFYPLADLFLFVLVLNLLPAYGSGEYGASWKLILAGFITMTVSDLFYSYASWNGLYYPELKATWMSTLLVDGLYNLSYMQWALGMYLLYIQLRQYHPFKISVQQTLVPNAHILIVTKKDETVIDVSQNYHHLYTVDDVKGKSLGEVLELTKGQEDVFHEKLVRAHRLIDEPIQIKDRSGNSYAGWLCGIAVTSPQGDYSGGNLLVRLLVEEDEFDRGLSAYQKSMVLHVLKNCDIDESADIKQVLLDYYLAYIKALFNLTFREGGAPLSQQLLDELQSIARKKGWQLKFNPQLLLDGGSESPEVLKAALPLLLDTSKKFTTQISDSVIVEAQIRSVDSQISEATHKRVRQYEKYFPETT